MLDNLVNGHDLRRLARKVRHGELGKIARLATRRPLERVEAAWAGTERPTTSWWEVPAVRARWNRMVSGDPAIDPTSYLSGRYLAGRSELRALSVGCGTGSRERAWAATGAFARIEAFDLSRPRIQTAQRDAREHGIANVLDFRVGDVLGLPDRADAFDVILGEGSLHHLSPIEDVLRRMRRWLRPDGFLFVNDFVGPTRMQWSDRQLEVINGLLAVLPARFRARHPGHEPKASEIRPSRLSMWLSDPSEAVESSRILPLLHELFDVIEMREYGGSILHMLFHEIAHNFLGDDPETRRALRMCFDAEDLLMASGEVASDFAVVVCRRRPETA